MNSTTLRACSDELSKLAVDPTNKLNIMYVGTEFGAGHISQAKAVAAAAKKRGLDPQLIDFHRTFGKPAARKAYERGVAKHLKEKGVVTGAKLVGAHANYYIRGVKQDKLKRFFDKNEGPTVVTIPHLQMAMRSVDRPVHVLHTDPEKWVGEFDQSVISKGKRIHIGTRQATAALPLAREKRVISGLAVHPDVLKRKKKTGLMEKGHNITVSGGAQGLEVLPMTKQVLRADLPDDAVVHAVSGHNKGVHRSLRALAKKDPRVRPYGFAPLGAMIQEADLNVIRAHGTAFAETVASGKPAVYYGPRAGILDYQGALTEGTARFGKRQVGNPSAIGLKNIPGAVNTVLADPKKFKRVARIAKKRMGNPADQVVQHIMRDSK